MQKFDCIPVLYPIGWKKERKKKKDVDYNAFNWCAMAETCKNVLYKRHMSTHLYTPSALPSGLSLICQLQESWPSNVHFSGTENTQHWINMKKKS